MSRHIHDHRKTKAVQPARIAKTLAITTADVHEVQTRDQDHHTITTTIDAAATANENQIALEVPKTGKDPTNESAIQDLPKTTTTTTTNPQKIPRTHHDLPPPTTTTNPQPQNQTQTTP